MSVTIPNRWRSSLRAGGASGTGENGLLGSEEKPRVATEEAVDAQDQQSPEPGRPAT